MNYGELVGRVSALLEMPSTQVDAVLKEAAGVIKDTVAAGGRVMYAGIGTFKLKTNARLVYPNPADKTKQTVILYSEPRWTLTFQMQAGIYQNSQKSIVPKGSV